jgi:Protein of unknown function (DUF2802)
MAVSPVLALVIYISLTAAAVVVGLAVQAALFRRERAALQGLALDLATLQGGQAQQVRAQAELIERLERVAVACGRLDERLERLELRGGERSYGRAIALAQRGGEPDDLVRDFGLSRAEAELVAVVHARRTAN